MVVLIFIEVIHDVNAPVNSFSHTAVEGREDIAKLQKISPIVQRMGWLFKYNSTYMHSWYF